MALENGCPCAKKHIGNPSKTRKRPTWPSLTEFLDSQIIIEIKSQQDWKRLTAQNLLIRLGEQSYHIAISHNQGNTDQNLTLQLNALYKSNILTQLLIMMKYQGTSVFTILLEDNWNACYRIHESLLQNFVNGHAKKNVYIIHRKHSDRK